LVGLFGGFKQPVDGQVLDARFLTVARPKSGDSGLFGFPEARVPEDSIAADWVRLMDGVGVCLVEVVAASQRACYWSRYVAKKDQNPSSMEPKKECHKAALASEGFKREARS
jgi:hypothetical protein